MNNLFFVKMKFNYLLIRDICNQYNFEDIFYIRQYDAKQQKSTDKMTCIENISHCF